MDASGWSAKRWAETAGTYGSNITRLTKNPLGSACPKNDTLAKLARVMPESAKHIPLPKAVVAAVTAHGGSVVTAEPSAEQVGDGGSVEVAAASSLDGDLYGHAERTVTSILADAGVFDETVIRRVTAMYYHKLASDRS